MKQDAFKDFHPIVNFTYFVFVLSFTMVFNHPAAQVISLLCAVIYAVQCEGKKAVLFTLKFSLPMLLLTAFINPAFNHSGVTILCYLPTGNPLTLESILYGLSAGTMLAAILLWFLSFNRVITSDKFIYLFGRMIPALSLVLSMALRFIPKFKAQLEMVKEAQKCIGYDTENGSIFRRLKNAVTVLSIMITWSLENAIETADSMKSRGYGLKGRTAFSIYRFDERDKITLGIILFCGLYLVIGSFANGLAFRYFPSIRCVSANALTVSFQIMYFVLCIIPVVINRKEAKKWTALRSKI